LAAAASASTSAGSRIGNARLCWNPRPFGAVSLFFLLLAGTPASGGRSRKKRNHRTVMNEERSDFDHTDTGYA